MLTTPPVLKPYRHSQTSSLSAHELVEAIVGDHGIYKTLENRWNAYTAHQQWHMLAFQINRLTAEPTFIDDEGKSSSGNKALLPCDTVNTQLSALVELCINGYQKGVVSEFFERVKSNPEYQKRLNEIPALTGCAEAEMEKYYAKEALKKFEVPEANNEHIGINDAGIYDVKVKAEGRLATYLDKQKITYHYKDQDGLKLLVADNPDNQKHLVMVRRILRLDETLKPFPYTHNYEHIAYGEAHLLRATKHHANTPDSLVTDTQAGLLGKASGADAQRIIDQHPEVFGYTNLDDKYMTFVGSGALPLTGIMNNIVTGCKVNLVDFDPEAVDISRKLITYLELLGVIETNAIKIYGADARDVHYGGPRKNEVDRSTFAGEVLRGAAYTTIDASGNTGVSKKDLLYVPTDILYVAGLIPNYVKDAVLLNLEHNQIDPVKTMMVRSARGLSAMLYESVQEGAFYNNFYYHPHGTMVPERHVMDDDDAIRAYKEETLPQASVSAVLSDDNVNTAELLFRSTFPMDNPSVMYEEGSKFAQLVEDELGRKPDFSHVSRTKAKEELKKPPTKT